MLDSQDIETQNKGEEEKTKFERAEHFAKNSIYGIFFLLLKEQETTFWKFVFLLFIEFLQLLSFSFNPSVSTLAPHPLAD